MNHRIFALPLACALLSSGVQAMPLSITNAGFEAPYFAGNLPVQYNGIVPASAFPSGGPPSGWSNYDPDDALSNGGFVGILNPGPAGNPFGNFPGGAAEGDNVALLYQNGDESGSPYGIWQELSATLQTDTIYTLTVAVGNIDSGQSIVEPYASLGFYDLRGFPGYQVQLLAGGVVLAEDDNSLLPGEGLWQTSQIQYTMGMTHAQLGENLQIRLINLNNADVPGVRGLEVDFDDVQLHAAAVPLPAAIWLMLAAVASLPGLGLWRKPANRRQTGRQTGVGTQFSLIC